LPRHSGAAHLIWLKRKGEVQDLPGRLQAPGHPDNFHGSWAGLAPVVLVPRASSSQKPALQVADFEGPLKPSLRTRTWVAFSSHSTPSWEESISAPLGVKAVDRASPRAARHWGPSSMDRGRVYFRCSLPVQSARRALHDQLGRLRLQQSGASSCSDEQRRRAASGGPHALRAPPWIRHTLDPAQDLAAPRDYTSQGCIYSLPERQNASTSASVHCRHVATTVLVSGAVGGLRPGSCQDV